MAKLTGEREAGTQAVKAISDEGIPRIVSVPIKRTEFGLSNRTNPKRDKIKSLGPDFLNCSVPCFRVAAKAVLVPVSKQPIQCPFLRDYIAMAAICC